MHRITPLESLSDEPCSVVAVACALNGNAITGDYYEKLRNDGYATLDVANKYIRANLPIKKRLNFRRGLRPKLKHLHFAGKAIVCVYGHFLYLDHEEYWSFFDNEDDEVVTIWEIR